MEHRNRTQDVGGACAIPRVFPVREMRMCAWAHILFRERGECVWNGTGFTHVLCSSSASLPVGEGSDAEEAQTDYLQDGQNTVLQ